jgi:hypothetical protein
MKILISTSFLLFVKAVPCTDNLECLAAIGEGCCFIEDNGSTILQQCRDNTYISTIRDSVYYDKSSLVFEGDLSPRIAFCIDQVRNFNIEDRHQTFPYSQPYKPYDYETKRDVINPMINSDMFFVPKKPKTFDEALEKYALAYATNFQLFFCFDYILILLNSANYFVDQFRYIFSSEENPYLASSMSENMFTAALYGPKKGDYLDQIIEESGEIQKLFHYFDFFSWWGLVDFWLTRFTITWALPYVIFDLWLGFYKDDIEFWFEYIIPPINKNADTACFGIPTFCIVQDFYHLVVPVVVFGIITALTISYNVWAIPFAWKIMQPGGY